DTEVVSALEEAKQDYGDFLHVYVGTSTGSFTVEPPAQLPKGYDPRKRPWYQAAMAASKPVITAPYVDAITHKLTFTVADRLPDGKGVVGADITLDTFDHMVNTIGLGTAGYLGLVDGQFHAIALHGIAPGTELKVAAMREIYQHTSGAFTLPLKGATYHVIYTTNPLTGWKVFGIVPTSTYFSAVRPILVTTLIVTLVALLASAVGIWFIVRSITVPLAQLVRFAERVGQGHLNADLHVRSRDELGQLAHAFRKMVASLRDMIRGVESHAEQVAASSQELTASGEENTRATEQIAEIVQHIAARVEQQAERAKEDRARLDTIAEDVESVAQSAGHAVLTAQTAVREAREG
ncbi:methyl-accepting chemotaxis protein, partial [Alicyclobacillus sendaiensis]